GTKVVGVSPDYAEYDKFADIWLPARAGTDGALAMAMTHVILTEFYVKKQTPYFMDYVKQYTDLPFLVMLKNHNGETRTDRFLRSSDFHDEENLGEWKTVVWNEVTNQIEIPNGSQGFRWDGGSKWNLDLEKEDGSQIKPRLSFLETSDAVAQVTFPYFAEKEGGTVSRTDPVENMTDKYGNNLTVRPVFYLMLADVGADRLLTGDYPLDYNDPNPYTPRWQDSI